jgi:hypothetical protein
MSILNRTTFERDWRRLLRKQHKTIVVESYRTGARNTVQYAISRSVNWQGQQVLANMNLPPVGRTWNFLAVEYGDRPVEQNDIIEFQGTRWIVQSQVRRNFDAMWSCICTQELVR